MCMCSKTSGDQLRVSKGSEHRYGVPLSTSAILYSKITSDSSCSLSVSKSLSVVIAVRSRVSFNHVVVIFFHPDSVGSINAGSVQYSTSAVAVFSSKWSAIFVMS